MYIIDRHANQYTPPVDARPDALPHNTASTPTMRLPSALQPTPARRARVLLLRRHAQALRPARPCLPLLLFLFLLLIPVLGRGRAGAYIAVGTSAPRPADGRRGPQHRLEQVQAIRPRRRGHRQEGARVGLSDDQAAWRRVGDGAGDGGWSPGCRCEVRGRAART